MTTDLIYYEIAQSVRRCLIEWHSRSYIFPYEWMYLKKYGFPFDIPGHKLLTSFFSFIEIKDLDLSPLIYILEQRFPCFEKVYKNVIEEYAW